MFIQTHADKGWSIGKAIDTNCSCANDIRKTALAIVFDIIEPCCLGERNAGPVIAGFEAYGSIFLCNSQGDEIKPLAGVACLGSACKQPSCFAKGLICN